MDALLKYWTDKYSPSELIDHVGISMEDLQFCLMNWFEEHLDDFKEDVETIFGYGEDTDAN